MAKPSLTVGVEPTSGSNLYYQAMAPSFKGGTARTKIIVRLRITNNESDKVRVTAIAFHFPGSNHSAIQMKAETKALVPDSPEQTAIEANGWIEPHITATWSNGTVNLTDDEDSEQVFNQVYLTGTVPAKISIHIKCEDFSDVVKKDFDLKRFKNPTVEGAFLFPFSVADMADGEYFVTQGEHWANGGANGLQIYAHDILLEGTNNGSLTQLKPGITTATKNSDFRIWGIPVRAVADGYIEEAFDDSPNNDYTGDFPDDPPEANHVWIKHGDIYVYYTHLQRHSIPDSLKPVDGQPKPFIRAGETIGKAGNSGNASGPHTHIHCAHGSMDGGLRPFVFRKARILDLEQNNPPSTNGKWVTLNAEGVSKESVSIWPESTWPGFKIPTAGLTVRGDWGYKFWQGDDYDEFRNTGQGYFDSGYPMTYASSYLDNGHRRWVGIARQSNEGTTHWISSSWDSFLTEANALHKDKGKRLIHVHAFEEGNSVKYFGLAQTGDWANTCWMSNSYDEFKAKANDLAKNEKRALVHMSNITIDGTRRWIGISRSASFTTEFFWTDGLTAFLKKLEDFDKAGKHCIYMFPYKTQDGHRWAGIVRKIDGPVEVWQNTNWDSFNEVVRYAQASQGRRLIAVEFPE
jgi:Peptidase family M23